MNKASLLKTPTLLLVVIILMQAPDSHALDASITQVFSPDELNGTLVVEDFEDDTFVSDVMFFSDRAPVRRVTADAASSGVTTSGDWGLTTRTTTALGIGMDFASPVQSFGLFFGNDSPDCSSCGSGFNATVDIFDESGLIGSISVAANMNDFVDQFIGFNTDARVTRTTIRYGRAFDTPLFTFIDDVQFSTVPEPSTLYLAGMGLVGLVCWRRFQWRFDSVGSKTI